MKLCFIEYHIYNLLYVWLKFTKISSIFGLTKLIYAKLDGSFVAKCYMSNNSLRPTVPDTSSNRHSRSLLVLNLYTHKTGALILTSWATAVCFGVDTIVELLLCFRV